MEADGFSLDDERQKVEANDILDIVEKWKTNHRPRRRNPRKQVSPVDLQVQTNRAQRDRIRKTRRYHGQSDGVGA
jgi:hypothetical protein